VKIALTESGFCKCSEVESMTFKFPNIDPIKWQIVMVNVMKSVRRRNFYPWSDLEYAQEGLDPDLEAVKRIMKFAFGDEE
jgi:hypothetical protein